MRKFTQEEEEFFARALEEAEKYDEKYGYLTEEEFWTKWENLKQETREKERLERKSIRLNIVNGFGKISKKFIKI